MAMKNRWTQFEEPFLDPDLKIFGVADARRILQLAGEDPTRQVRVQLPAYPETDEVLRPSRSCSLAKAVAHRLNLAAQWWRIVDLESGRPSPKSVASCVLAAYGNAQRLVKLLGARHDLERGIARPHPALRRLLNEARTSRTGEANPQESIGCDLKSLLRLAQDLEAATRQLGHPDDVESEKPSQADPEMDEFVQSLQRIWEDVIGRRAATSVTSETKSRKGGEATGPFVKFVVGSTHMLPGQEKQTAKALRARIRRVLKQRVTPAS